MELTTAVALLALLALGGKVAFHLLHPHPYSSPATRRARAAILVLVAGGEGAMVVHLLSLVTGRVFLLLEHLLGRVMGLVCLLLFVNACVAYFRQKYLLEDGGKRRHPCSGSAYAKENPTLSGRTVMPAEDGRRRGSYLAGFVSFFRGCLWVMTVAVFVDTLLQPGVYPCTVTTWVPFTLLPARTLVGRDLGKGSSAPAKLYAAEVVSPQTAEFATAGEEFDQLEVGFRFAQEKNLSRPVLLYYGWVKQLSHEGTCVGYVYNHFFLDGLFHLVLLLYLACSVLWSRRRAVLGDSASASESETEDIVRPGSVRKQKKLAADDAHVPLRQNDRSSRDPAQNDVTCKPGSPQPSFASISIKSDASAAGKRPDDDSANPQKTTGKKQPLRGASDDPNLLEMIMDETKLLHNGNSSLPSVGGSEASSEAQFQKSVPFSENSDLRSGESATEEGCFPVRSAASENVETEEECSVCRQVAPYVPLATLVLLVQHVLVLPLWGAVMWREGRQLLAPPPAALFLPTYCAVCFVFRAIMNDERRSSPRVGIYISDDSGGS